MNKNQRKVMDQRIGLQLKKVRRSRGCTQAALSRDIDLSIQQVQKYEKEGNRISASLLYHLAYRFDVPLEYFFGDEEPENYNQPDSNENSHTFPCPAFIARMYTN